MIKKLVRLEVWVTPQQKAKVQKQAAVASKAEKRKVSNSEIVRALIK